MSEERSGQQKRNGWSCFLEELLHSYVMIALANTNMEARQKSGAYEQLCFAKQVRNALGVIIDRFGMWRIFVYQFSGHSN